MALTSSQSTPPPSNSPPKTFENIIAQFSDTCVVAPVQAHRQDLDSDGPALPGLSKDPLLVLPKRISLVNTDKKYVASTSGVANYVEKFGRNCIWEVVDMGHNMIQLKDLDGRFLFMTHLEVDKKTYYVLGVSAEKHTTFQLIYGSGNSIYLTTKYAGHDIIITNETQTFHTPVIEFTAIIGADFVLLPSYLLEITEPIDEKEIYDVVYDIKQATIEPLEPSVIFSTDVRNDSGEEVTQTLQYSYTKSVAGTWNISAGVEIGTKVSFDAGAPFIIEGGREVSVSDSSSHEWGGSEGQKKIISSLAAITIPPKTHGKALVILKQAKLEVSFTYKKKLKYTTDEVEIFNGKKGIYKNLDTYNVEVKLEQVERI